MELTHEQWQQRVADAEAALVVAQRDLVALQERASSIRSDRDLYRGWQRSATASLRSVQSELSAARKARKVLEKEYLGLLDAEPEPVVDPPTLTDPDDAAIAAFVASLPAALQAKLPEFPWYSVPTEERCDYIIEPGKFTATRNGKVTVGSYPMGRAYQDFKRHFGGSKTRCTFGVRGDIGRQLIGYGYGSPSLATIHWESAVGEFAPIDVDIVGLDTTAEMAMTLGNKFGFIESLRVFNLGLRGEGGNFIVSSVEQTGGVEDELGDIVFDGCWFLNTRDWVQGERAKHTSAVHLGDHRSLIFRRTRRAADMTGEHSFFGHEHILYDKSSYIGPTWIVQNNLVGANRTGFQRRPQRSSNDRPQGDYIVMLNEINGHGWDHGDERSTFAGGSAITVWTNPDHTTFILGNDVKDAKYGCLAINPQPEDQDKNWYVRGEDGQDLSLTHKEVWVWANTFENSHAGHPENLPRRGAVSISGVQLLHIGENDFQNNARLSLMNEWSYRRSNFPNGEVRLYGSSAYWAGVDVRAATPTSNGKEVPVDVEERAAMLREYSEVQ